MTSTEQRKKQPAITRQQLLDVTADIILEKGLSTVTLDAVAKAAGVSKGGLLHHFPSKQHLIDALLTALYERFLGKIQNNAAADDCETGRRTRAYLRAIVESRTDSAKQLCGILSVEARDNPVMKSQWGECRAMLGDQAAANGADPIMLAIIQLAADGLWLADLDGAFDHTPDLYQQIVTRLEQLTRVVAATPSPAQPQ